MTYGVKEVNKIIRMGKDKEKLKRYIESFPIQDKRCMYIILLQERRR